MLVSTPLLVTMILIIAAEYLLLKRKGLKIAKYSNLVDFAPLFLFTVDWSVTLVGSLSKIEKIDPPTFLVTAIYGFTNFSWKTLLIILIVQKLQLRIIPPVVASIISAVYCNIYNPSGLVVNIIRNVFQIFNIVLIIYCEDKIQWKMIWTNMKQEKWMQVNNFILNNIPENIMILDLSGEFKFISDYYKSFMDKCNLIPNTKEFFDKLRDLHQPTELPSVFSSKIYHL